MAREALRAAGPSLLLGLRRWASVLFLGVPSCNNWLHS
jgi:hypothetical protein